jgi:hypothetical protein
MKKTVDSKGFTKDKKEPVGNNIFDDKGEFSAKDTPALTFRKTSEVYELRDGSQHAIITISTEGEGKKIKSLKVKFGPVPYEYSLLNEDIEFLHTATRTALEMVKENNS